MAVDLAFVDLDTGVSRLRKGLDVPPNKRGMKWSSSRCVYSRFVHKNIWEVHPEKDRVEGIVQLLRKTRAAVITACFAKTSHDEREKLIIYARNIGLRIVNLEENYLKDKPSDFARDDNLVQEEKRVRDEIDRGIRRASEG